MVIAFCFGCRDMREMKRIREETGKNNCICIKGDCVKCGRGMFKLKGKAKRKEENVVTNN